ncbi:discoidin domain-containing protein [Anaerocolumna jejuensis]|uniref:discoidin domain-containing protein n=1 Tax=Anaerocolumna jejuensis TaxID=259063 RepID=UPI003F7B8757
MSAIALVPKMSSNSQNGYTALSNVNDHHNFYYAFDGDDGVPFTNSNTSGNFYIGIKFPRPEFVESVMLKTDTSIVGLNWAYTIQTSLDGVTYTNIKTITSSSSAYTKVYVDLGRIKCQYIRLLRTGAMWFNELQFYGYHNLFLLRKNDKYYSTNKTYYDINTKNYMPLVNLNASNYEDYGFVTDDLFKETTIGTETFKPIDKFNNFNLMNVNVVDSLSFNLKGIKSNRELVVQAFDINTSLYKKINNIITNLTTLNHSSIKIVFSTDSGETWNTILNNKLETTDCIIPKKRYIDFTNDDLLHFNAARETIYEVGCTSDILNIFDFNTLNAERLRFAYVFSTDSYVNNPSLNKLTINYDEKGYQREMKDSECDIEVFDHTVKLKPTISATSIEANIII